MAHGAQDPIIPLPLAEQSRETLRELGHTVEWHQYPMQHSVCMEEIGAIAEWLRGRLGL
jgi:phospholipase/carboxylesterase